VEKYNQSIGKFIKKGINMTTRKILLATAAISLLMAGCAQKRNLDPTTSGEFGTGTTDGTYTTVTEGYDDNTGHYDNVDPYGNGNYGGNNGSYGNNGGYADGSKGYGNGAAGIQNVYFDVDQYAITSDKLAIISHNASLIRGDIENGAKLKIEGHCDATGSDEYNYALGLRRAKAAKDAMVLNGIKDNSISLMSMGESSPACTSSSSAECYAKNRRVEFKVFQ
jgi:peptidoglycan-associated lipoprotein